MCLPSARHGARHPAREKVKWHSNTSRTKHASCAAPCRGNSRAQLVESTSRLHPIEPTILEYHQERPVLPLRRECARKRYEVNEVCSLFREEVGVSTGAEPQYEVKRERPEA